MDKMKAISVALMLHAPGLIFMNWVHVSWPLVLMVVLSVGIVFGLIMASPPTGYQWDRYAYEPVTILDLKMAKAKDREFTDV